jgi:glutamate formiminotransferase
VLECVVNISEGRDRTLVERISAAAGAALLDVHSDPHHHRSVLTLLGEDAARAVATAAISSLDLAEHAGAHPRLGVVDVVPFVALDGTDGAEAVRARADFARWLAATHAVPAFLYGPDRTLPAVRRDAFTALPPDHGPAAPHPTAGATAVGARPVLVAYNVWVSGTDLAGARRLAAAVRSAALRARGLQVGDRLQVSMNLIEPATVGPGQAFDAVAAAAAELGASVDGAELVGLVPDAVLRAEPSGRWADLDLGPDRTIEARRASSG